MTNKIDINSTFVKLLALASFCALYPAFFWYHFAIGTGWVESPLINLTGGLYGRTAVISAIVFSTLFLFGKGHAETPYDWILKLFFAYLIWAVFWSIFNLIFLREYYTWAATVKMYKDLTLQLANFLLGYFLIVNFALTAKILFGLMWCSIVVLCFSIYTPDYDTVWHALNFKFRDLRSTDVEFASYQGLSRSFAFTTLLLLAVLRHQVARHGVFVTATATLYLIGSKSEILGVILAGLAFEVGMFLLEPRRYAQQAICTLLALGLPLLLFFESVSRIFENTRITRLLDMQTDMSTSERFFQIISAVDIIRENPFLGSYGKHLEFATHGDMPHHVLASWTMLGLPGFLMLVALLFGTAFISIKQNLKNGFELSAWRFALLVSFFTLLLAFVSKSAFVEWLPLSFGAVLAAARTDTLATRMAE